VELGGISFVDVHSMWIRIHAESPLVADPENGVAQLKGHWCGRTIELEDVIRTKGRRFRIHHRPATDHPLTMRAPFLGFRSGHMEEVPVSNFFLGRSISKQAAIAMETQCQTGLFFRTLSSETEKIPSAECFEPRMIN
jgi:hypothetical protein